VIPALIKSWPANYPGRASFEIIPPWVLVRGRLTVTYLTAGAGYFSLPSGHSGVRRPRVPRSFLKPHMRLRRANNTLPAENLLLITFPASERIRAVAVELIISRSISCLDVTRLALRFIFFFTPRRDRTPFPHPSPIR